MTEQVVIVISACRRAERASAQRSLAVCFSPLTPPNTIWSLQFSTAEMRYLLSSSTSVPTPPGQGKLGFPPDRATTANPPPFPLSYAGEDAPKTVFPTSYSTIPGSGDTPDTCFHGTASTLYRPRALHSNPISDGLVTDWNAIERTLDHAFRDRMRLTTLEEYPLLVTEPSWNTNENRERMCELAFEKWQAPAYYAVDRSVMSS